MSHNGPLPGADADVTPTSSLAENTTVEPLPAYRVPGVAPYVLLKRLRVLDYLQHFYETRVRPARQEQERLEREAQARLEAVNGRRRARQEGIEREIDAARQLRVTLEAELTAAERAFVLAHEKANPSNELLTPTLRALFPGAEPPLETEPTAVCQDKGGKLRQVTEVVAPFMCGGMLALCLGTLIGILDLSDLDRLNERWPSLIIAWVLGFVIVYLIGQAADGTVRAFWHAVTPGPTRPRARSSRWWPLFVLAIATAVLFAAEITAETFGLRELHLQRLQALRHEDGTTALELLPYYIYALIGTLISGPYLVFKMRSSWVTLVRSTRCSGPQPGWLTEPEATSMAHSETPFEPILTHAVDIGHLRASIKEIDARLPVLTAERDALEPVQTWDSEIRERWQEATNRHAALLAQFEKMVEAHVFRSVSATDTSSGLEEA
jgi:hypothetical protein